MNMLSQISLNCSNITVINNVGEKDEKLLNFINEKNHCNRSVKLVLSSFDEKYGFETNSLCQKVFNKPSKSTRKMIKKVFESPEPSLSVLNIIKILSISLKINNDLIIKNYNSDVERITNPSSLTVDFTKKLLKRYPEDRVVKLLLNDDLSLIADTAHMINEIEDMREIDFLPKKPKTIKEIHDSLSRMMLKLNIPNYSLEQREDILILDDKALNDNMVIRVPKTHYDLIDLGEDLNFCIGNGYYSKEVKEGRCSVVSIYKNNKPLYGIQFNRYAISQAYGFDNEEIPQDILLLLQDALISEPLVPKDFIAISDSGWIQGFKYNNKDLYIMMNHNIYVYFDVEKETYEELLTSDRKGTYVNQIIKPNYSYEKIN